VTPADLEQWNVAMRLGLPLAVIALAYVIGSWLERRHFRRIREREEAFRTFPVTTFEALPENWRVGGSELVAGSVVVSLDYFKRIVAGLRGLVGGRIRTYEPLLDRARREALLRMIEVARNRQYDAVINVRLETSRLANAKGNGEGTAGVEMLAFGTAVKLDRR